MSAATDPKVAAHVCAECSGPLPADVELFMPICDACLDAEHDRVMAEAKEFRQPAPPPIPVRERYYMIECEHCGWVGSSEQCGGEDDDIVCPVCCSSICGDGPSEADTAKHGEAVMQRILAAEARAAQAEARFARLLVAFHDATRRPLGVTPDSGMEFYRERLAEEAEERRPRIGTPAEIAERPETRAAEAMRKACWRVARDDAGELHSADSVATAERIMAGIQAHASRPSSPTTGGAA